MTLTTRQREVLEELATLAKCPDQCSRCFSTPTCSDAGRRRKTSAVLTARIIRRLPNA